MAIKIPMHSKMIGPKMHAGKVKSTLKLKKPHMPPMMTPKLAKPKFKGFNGGGMNGL